METSEQPESTPKVVTVFDGTRIPRQETGESVDEFRARTVRFWTPHRSLAPAWVKAEIAETSDEAFDDILVGDNAASREACFAQITGSVLSDVAQHLKDILEKKLDRDKVYEMVLRATLEHQSKMQVERLKTRGTMRVERQRFHNEMEILKAAQGAIQANDRITITLAPMTSRASKLASALLTSARDVDKQESSDPDSVFDEVSGEVVKQTDVNKDDGESEGK